MIGLDVVVVVALIMFRLKVDATTPSLLMTGTAWDEKVLINFGLMLEIPF